MNDVIAFKKVREPYGWLSNMSPHPVGEFRTAEALFQAIRFSDLDIIAQIQTAKSPMGAKMIAKKYADKMVVQPRSTLDLANMMVVLRAKVIAHPNLKAELLATGDRVIVEDVSSRPNESGLFWGAAKNTNGTWRGENMLGRMWMDLRVALSK